MPMYRKEMEILRLILVDDLQHKLVCTCATCREDAAWHNEGCMAGCLQALYSRDAQWSGAQVKDRRDHLCRRTTCVTTAVASNNVVNPWREAAPIHSSA